MTKNLLVYNKVSAIRYQIIRVIPKCINYRLLKHVKQSITE